WSARCGPRSERATGWAGSWSWRSRTPRREPRAAPRRKSDAGKPRPGPSVPPRAAGGDALEIRGHPRHRSFGPGEATGRRSGLLQLPDVRRRRELSQRGLEVAEVGQTRLLQGGPAGALHRHQAGGGHERVRPPLVNEQARDPEVVAAVIPEGVPRRP